MPNSYKYDVFISYRQQDPDKSWVRNTLVPTLEASGIKVCIDYQCFHLGIPLITQIERAVLKSRYTLAVLTPAYLRSNFTQLENILAEHLGLENSQRRLLTIMREQCQPRLSIRSRLWLDMSDDTEFITAINRLIFELKQSPNL